MSLEESREAWDSVLLNILFGNKQIKTSIRIVELRQKPGIPVIACWIQTAQSTSTKEITMVQMLSLLPRTYASYEIIRAALSSKMRICLLVLPRTFCSVKETTIHPFK